MSEDPDIRLAIADYLKSKGWSVVLVGDHGVRKRHTAPLKYEYTMEFLGKKVQDSEGQAT